MPNGIEMFNGRGAMLPLAEIEPQLIDDATRERFKKVRAAYIESMAADAELAAAVESVETCMTQFDNAKDYLAKNFRQPTRIEEVKNMIRHQAEQRARH